MTAGLPKRIYSCARTLSMIPFVRKSVVSLFSSKPKLEVAQAVGKITEK